MTTLQLSRSYQSFFRATKKEQGSKPSDQDYNKAVDKIMEDVPLYKPRLSTHLKTVDNSYVVSVGCVGVITAWILGD
jgi:hypothetical protein